MNQTVIQPAAARPAPRAVAEADEAAARLLVAQRELLRFCRERTTALGRAHALGMIRRQPTIAAGERFGVFDGDRLVESHADGDVAHQAALDNADATDRPGAYEVRPLCPRHPDEPADECGECPGV